MRIPVLRMFLVIALAGFCRAQASSTNKSNSSADTSGMEGMQQGRMQSDSFIGALELHVTAGTDAQPNSTPSEMLMRQKGSWMLMLHGEAFINDIQQSGPRGADKLFSTNWIMPMAQRKLAHGTLTLRTMLSLEPATVTGERYPELLQQGETAFGKAIVDGQHPHNFFMEVAAIYDYHVSDNSVLSFYAAPVGDPALGPPAYPHRTSASENPIAPLGHHLEDSTHISDDVVTFGITHGIFRLEASGFHGQEPDEYRWDIDAGKIDSWSTRFTVNPGRNWSFQYSIADLTAVEALFPHEDVRRMTASLIYNRPLHRGNWDSMLLWGRNQSLQDGNVGNAYLLESTLRFFDKNNVWTRIENVDRTNELLLGERFLPAGFVERYFARVQAYTFGYDREVGRARHMSVAPGAQFTTYAVPNTLSPSYGSHPFGVVAFLRVRVD
jgi:hypothetical protein